jgi:HD-GYP domain-containing protein (c-di-GMP phosphodiesterase class II)
MTELQVEESSRAVERYRSAYESRRWCEQLEGELRKRATHITEIIASQYIDSDEALDILLATLTATNPDAYIHAHRVATLSATLARALDLTDAETATVERGGLLHDLGKLAMPDAVLRKPAPLTPEEQRLIRLHPGIGSGLIAPVPYLASAAVVVRDAHERVDGLGYPHGKRGDEVWIGARIVAVADAYDTMIHARVFRDAVTPEAALAELRRCSGTQFDARVVRAIP